MMGILLFTTVFLIPRPAGSIFGEAMMFLYYGYLLPLSSRITRGIYTDGVWTDSGFMSYGDIGGLTWKEGAVGTLVLASRLRAFARHADGAGHQAGRGPAAAAREDWRARHRVRRRARAAPGNPRHAGKRLDSQSVTIQTLRR